MKSLIIFADYGLDDAAATANILKNKNAFKDITIVPIGGNVPTDISYRNCLTLLDTAKACDITVVDTRHISQPYEYLKDIHGGDGMGDIFEHRENICGFKVLDFNKWIDTLTGEEIVLSLGPMTLVKPVMEKYQNKQLIIMGGCIKEKPNFKGYEFNHALDTEAFSYCTRFSHVAITLDSASVPVLNMHSYDIEDTSLYHKILNASKRLSRQRNESGCYVYDDIAACYLLHPDRFETQSVKDPYGNLITNAIYTAVIPQYK